MRHRARAVQRLERFGDRPVQRARAREPELRVQRLLQQRMRKVIDDVVGLGALGEDVGGAQLVDRRDQRVVVEPADRRELVVRRSAPSTAAMSASRRASGDRSARRASTASRIVAGTRSVFDVPSRPRAVRSRAAARLDERLDRFVDEERIAAGPAMQPLGEGRGARVGRRRTSLEQLGDRRRSAAAEAKRVARRLDSAATAPCARSDAIRPLIGIVVRADDEHARSPPICRATKCSISSDALSAHCRFSSTSSSGRFAAKRDRNCVKFQSSRAFSSAGSPRGADVVGPTPSSSAGKELRELRACRRASAA